MSAEQAFAAILREAGAPPAALERLARYCALLERWSATHNLVRFGSRQELVERHVMEALSGRALMADRGVLADVGSGAGLPGVPLLAASPGWRGLLVEPRSKRATFLRLVVRELSLPAEVVEARYETLAREPLDLITARALGGWEAFLAWSRRQLVPGGAVLLWVTRPTAEELAGLPGWCVVSSALAGSREGRLLQLKPCST